MIWLQQVQDDISKAVFQKTEHKRQLMEALLWRGFLAELVNEKVILQIKQPTEQAAIAADCESLIKLGIQCHKQNGQQIELTWPAATRSNQWEETLKNIIHLPFPVGITSIGDGNPIYKGTLPANELDLGVALLVRSITRQGIKTKISGHGTESCRLYIELDNDYEAQKLRELIVHCGADRSSYFWQNGSLIFGTDTTDPVMVLQQFQDAQHLARSVFEYKAPVLKREECQRLTEALF